MALQRRFPNPGDQNEYESGIRRPGLMRRPQASPAEPLPEFHAPQPYQAGDGRTTDMDMGPRPERPAPQSPAPPRLPSVPPPPVATPPPTYDITGRDPVGRDRFDPMGYLKANPDVDAALRGGAFNRDPWEHYREYGFRENRPGAAAAPPPGAPAPAGGTPPPDSSGWDTDGYQAPAFQPVARGGAMPGWDATKWANNNHQTPKYGIGRILSNFPPTVEGLAQALPEIQRAYPGVTFDGKDKLMIPGVGTIDVLVGASQGGSSWAWQDLPELGVTPYTPAASSAAPRVPTVPTVRNSIMDQLEIDGPLRTARYRGGREV